MQASEWSEAANGDPDPVGHARPDSGIEKDAPAGNRADIYECGALIASPAPTEPQVTNVTSASAARVAIGDDERIVVGVLVEPAPCLAIEYDGELVHYAIMARRGRPAGRPRFADERLSNGSDRRDLVLHDLVNLRLRVAGRDLLQLAQCVLEVAALAFPHGVI